MYHLFPHFMFVKQEHIYKLMKSDSYSRFIRSSAYQELLQAKKKVIKKRLVWKYRKLLCMFVRFVHLYTLTLHWCWNLPSWHPQPFQNPVNHTLTPFLAIRSYSKQAAALALSCSDLMVG